MEGHWYYVITEKQKSPPSSSSLCKFMEIKKGNIYKLTLLEYKEKPRIWIQSGASAFIIDTMEIVRDREDGILFWEDGKIFPRVYYSEDFYGTYVKICE